MAADVPAGWYPDPHDPGAERYWSGTEWTQHRRPRAQPPMPAKPPNHLAFAIIVTVLCCLPLGIVAIVHAARVDSLWAGGDQAGAYQASLAARNWSIAAMIAFPVIAAFTMTFFVAVGSGMM